ncbi:hypothetical protein ACH5A2_21085 [Streptomyces collinus]|uniref:hypothetical protein n=1 Tax=Streptomyces collinus TaxID=42684 RepID=UPI00378DCF5B
MTIGLCVSLVKALRAQPTGTPGPPGEQQRAADADDKGVGAPEPDPDLELKPGPGVVPADALADSQPAS